MYDNGSRTRTHGTIDTVRISDFVNWNPEPRHQMIKDRETQSYRGSLISRIFSLVAVLSHLTSPDSLRVKLARKKPARSFCGREDEE